MTPVVELENLVVDYVTRTRTVRAVDGVSLSIAAGEIVGLAGESGCGKSTLGNAVMQVLRPPAQVTAGRVLFGGEDVVGMGREELRRFRWRNVSMVFQSAMNALNPVMRVGDQFVDMIRAHERVSKHEALGRAGDLLELVGIDRRRAARVPPRALRRHAAARRDRDGARAPPGARDHGRADDRARRRRAARDPAADPRAAGASSASQSSSSRTTSRCCSSSRTAIAIMYAGEIVEEAPAARLRDEPRAPVHASGCSGRSRRCTARSSGSPASPARRPISAAPPSGCRFHPRCPHCTPRRPRAVCAAGRRAAAPPRRRPRASRRLPSGDAHDDADPRGARALEAVPVGRPSSHRRAARGRRRHVRAPAGPDHGARGESGSGKSTVARLLLRLSRRPAARCCSRAATSPATGAGATSFATGRRCR